MYNWFHPGVSETSEHFIRKEVFQDRQLEAIRNWLICDEIVSKRQSGLSGVRLSSEVIRFCLRTSLGSQQTVTLHDLSTAIDTVRECFSVIGSPVINLVHDPEIEDLQYLVIEIQVRGGVKENVKAHREFAGKLAHLLGAKRETLRLHYDMI
jgi:hypothetical protein